MCDSGLLMILFLVLAFTRGRLRWLQGSSHHKWYQLHTKGGRVPVATKRAFGQRVTLMMLVEGAKNCDVALLC